jgi:phospholipase C
MSDFDPAEPKSGNLTAAISSAACCAGRCRRGRRRGRNGRRRRPAKGSSSRPVSDAKLRAAIDTVVVIFAENRSFNNLFADFPGLQQPLSEVPAERTRQRDRDGKVMEKLPKIWEGLVPSKQVVEHTEYLIGPDDLAPIPNGPFAEDARGRSAAARPCHPRSGPCGSTTTRCRSTAA